MSFSMTDIAKKPGVFFILLFLLKQHEICYFSLHSPGCFYAQHRCSGNELQRQHLCDPDLGLPCNTPLSYRADQLTCDTYSLSPCCNHLLSKSVAAPEFLELKTKRSPLILVLRLFLMDRCHQPLSTQEHLINS